MPEGIERRYLTGSKVELRQGGEDEPARIAGMAPPWNMWSADIGFRERFEPGAFRNLGDDGVITSTFEHEDSLLLGTTPNTLRLKETDEGLEYEVDIPDTTAGRDAAEYVRRGDVRGSSFEFRIVSKGDPELPNGGDRWAENDDGVVERTILKNGAILYQVGPVVNPAYPDTTAALRSLTEWRKLAGGEERVVRVPDVSTDLADPDTAWRRLRLQDFTSESWDDLSESERREIAGHFAVADRMPPESFGELKFPHHRAQDGKIVPRGVFAAAARLPQSELTDQEATIVRAHLARHYRQMEMRAPWERSTDRWDAYIEALSTTGILRALADADFGAELQAVAELRMEEAARYLKPIDTAVPLELLKLRQRSRERWAA